METKFTKGEWKQTDDHVIWSVEKKIKIAVTTFGDSLKKDCKEEKANAKLMTSSPKMFIFITEIQAALTDKSKHGTKLNLLEISMLNNANKIIKEVL